MFFAHYLLIYHFEGCSQTFFLNYAGSAINGIPNIQLYQDGIKPQEYNSSPGKYTDYTAGDIFKIIYELDSSGACKGILYKNGSEVLTYNFTNTNWQKNEYVYLWGQYSGDGAADIDLKDFKIIADGEELLSGSKLVQPDWQTKPFKFDVEEIN